MSLSYKVVAKLEQIKTGLNIIEVKTRLTNVYDSFQHYLCYLEIKINLNPLRFDHHEEIFFKKITFCNHINHFFERGLLLNNCFALN